MTPLIVCQNIHTVCRGCCVALKDQQQRSGNDAKCPQCRVDVWKHEVLNREKIYFLSKSMLVCGSCDSAVAMSCSTAQQHSKECVENHITCPLLNSDVTLSRCTHAMNISALWEHCQKFHILEGAPATMQIKTVKTLDTNNNGALTATLSTSVTFDKNNYLFFTLTTDKKSYNLCLHLTKEMPRDSSDPHYNGVASDSESVFVAAARGCCGFRKRCRRAPSSEIMLLLIALYSCALSGSLFRLACMRQPCTLLSTGTIKWTPTITSNRNSKQEYWLYVTYIIGDSVACLHLNCDEQHERAHLSLSTELSQLQFWHSTTVKFHAPDKVNLPVATMSRNLLSELSNPTKTPMKVGKRWGARKYTKNTNIVHPITTKNRNNNEAVYNVRATHNIKNQQSFNSREKIVKPSVTQK